MDSPYQYVAYIDESGDDGLEKVKPLDPNGSSEWLMLTAVIIRAENEHKIQDWVHSIVAAIGRRNPGDMHFTHLGHDQKWLVSKKLSEHPLKIVVVASNKKNMRGYVNYRAQKVYGQNWFYCWMTRLLLERITHFVKEDSLKSHGKVEKVKLEYSRRGGVSYSQMRAYYGYMKRKPLYLSEGEIHWDTLLPHYLEDSPHAQRFGFQLADIASGAFYRACDVHNSMGRCDPVYANHLTKKLIKTPSGIIAGYGLKLMPHTFVKANLLPSQEEIFRSVGYPDKVWWSPSAASSKVFKMASNGQASWDTLGYRPFTPENKRKQTSE